MHNFDLLPIEIQASVVELRAAAVDEAVIDQLVTRTLHALGVKSNRVQVEVLHMEDRLAHQLDQIGDKLQADMQTQHGETNGMLVDIRAAQQSQEAATGALRAEFHDGISALGERVSDNRLRINDLQDWREQVDATLESFAESRDQSRAQRTRTENAVTALGEQFRAFVAEIHALIAQGPTPEESQQYRAFLDDQMRRAREADS